MIEYVSLIWLDGRICINGVDCKIKILLSLATRLEHLFTKEKFSVFLVRWTDSWDFNSYFSLCSNYYRSNWYLMRIRMLYNILLQAFCDRYNCSDSVKERNTKKDYANSLTRHFWILSKNSILRILSTNSVFFVIINTLCLYSFLLHILYSQLLFILLCVLLDLILGINILIRSHL